MDWEYRVISAIQSLSQLNEGFFDFLFAALTFLAEESFLLFAIFIVYWCLNKRLGEYLLLSLFLSLSANGFIKDLARRPRPFSTPAGDKLRYVVIDNIFVDTASLGNSFSFPSGHSQCAGSLFTALALWLKKGWAYLLAGMLIVGVMVSRIYLGVHFPADVLAGAALGIFSSLICWWLFNRFYEKRIWLFVAVAVLLIPALFIAPSSDTVKTIGVGIGAVLGMAWEQHGINFTTGCRPVQVVLRMVVGLAIIAAIRIGLKIILPEAMIFNAIRYGLMGLAATGIAPWLFVRLKL